MVSSKCSVTHVVAGRSSEEEQRKLALFFSAATRFLTQSRSGVHVSHKRSSMLSGVYGLGCWMWVRLSKGGCGESGGGAEMGPAMSWRPDEHVLDGYW